MRTRHFAREYKALQLICICSARLPCQNIFIAPYFFFFLIQTSWYSLLHSFVPLVGLLSAAVCRATVHCDPFIRLLRPLPSHLYHSELFSRTHFTMRGRNVISWNKTTRKKKQQDIRGRVRRYVQLEWWGPARVQVTYTRMPLRTETKKSEWKGLATRGRLCVFARAPRRSWPKTLFAY